MLQVNKCNSHSGNTDTPWVWENHAPSILSAYLSLPGLSSITQAVESGVPRRVILVVDVYTSLSYEELRLVAILTSEKRRCGYPAMTRFHKTGKSTAFERVLLTFSTHLNQAIFGCPGHDRILWGSISCRFKSKLVIVSNRVSECRVFLFNGIKIADLNHLHYGFHFWA